MGLTAEEKTAVVDSWALVAKDLKGNSVKVFQHFFKMFPEYQKLFKGFADTPFDQLAENKRFKAHAFTVVSTLNGMIGNLDDPEMLVELLVKNGQNHAKRNIKVADFKNLIECLTDFFSKNLGEAWTSNAESGWKKVFAIVAEKSEEGLNASSE